jgi:hypothetical protein
LSKKINGKKTKKYKFTGNRAMAKRVRGNNYILQPPSYYRLSVIKSRIVKSKPWYNLDQKILAVNEHIKYLVPAILNLEKINQKNHFTTKISLFNY